jgi:transposase-like protein
MSQRKPKSEEEKAIEKETDAVIEVLLKKYGATPEGVFGKGGLIKALTRKVVEKALSGELTHHLGYARGAERPEEAEGNHRNGYMSKRVQSDDGEMEIAVPRDRAGSFEPLLVPKGRRRLAGLDEKIIGLYARGMTMRQIRGFLEEQYGVEVSPELISTVTDSVLEMVQEWQNRPLDRVYPIVIFDALWVKMKEEGAVRNQAVYLALGTRVDGTKEILGIWVSPNEGAKFWLRVMHELKQRGVEDLLIAVVDGLKGFPEAIRTVYPQTSVQTCIVHLTRYSLAFCSWRDRKAVAAALKEIYRAPNASMARAQLEAFRASELGQKYAMIGSSWQRAWEEVIPFFEYGPAIRKMIYTTNAIESVNMQIRKIIKTRGHFPSEEAALKLIYLALKNLTAKWSKPAPHWAEAARELAMAYGERFTALRPPA